MTRALKFIGGCILFAGGLAVIYAWVVIGWAVVGCGGSWSTRPNEAGTEAEDNSPGD